MLIVNEITAVENYYVTGEQTTQSIFEYIDCYYNFKRKHSTIGYTARICV